MNHDPLKVAWISYFPVEWLPEAPPEIRALPKRHPASWLQSGIEEFRKRDDIELHVFEVSKLLPRTIDFRIGNAVFHCIKTPGLLRSPTFFWLDTLVIKKALRKIQPDVVHAWGTEKGAALVASRLPWQSLVSLQGLMRYFADKLPSTRYERFVAWCEDLSLRRTTYASGESKFVTDYLKKNYPHLNVHHVEHAPSRSFFGLARNPETKPIQFLTLGAISYRKGTDLLLKALDRLKGEIDFRLTLIGFWANQDFLREIRASTSAELWQRVQVLETLPTTEVHNRLARCTMVLFPTRADTGPVAVKEAAVAGVPIIGSRMGGIPDYVTSGKNGLIFEPEDTEGLTSAIREACVHPLFSQGNVDQESLARARGTLNPQLMADQFYGIYRKLAEDRKIRDSVTQL